MFRLPFLFLVLLFSLHSFCGCAQTGYVDPRIGSEGLGRVFIGPSMPFGMAKPGPDCLSMPNAGWAPMPEVVKGFSQTHVSGTGGGQKYGNVLLQPVREGDMPSVQRLLMPDGSVVGVPVYAQRRTEESVALGLYGCRYGNGIETGVTTAERCAVYRFRHADGLWVDAASFLGMDTIPGKRETQQYVGSAITVTGPHEVVGRTTVRGGWNNGDPYTVFFCLQSDMPFMVAEAFDSLAVLLRFHSSSQEGDSSIVKLGISYVSVGQARRNITPLPFDSLLQQNRDTWARMLRRVPYHGTDREMRMFYTALYHTLLMPVDKTGENPKWTGGVYYDDFYAIWDTYRTSFPLLMEYYPERAVDMVNALLAIYRHEGYMPDARSGDCNGRTQGGSNAEVVIAEAFARGLKGIDYSLALEAMVKDAEVPPADDEREGRGGLREYNTLGYIPYGIPRAGTRTVEYSYDDWCIAQVAKGLGCDSLYGKYMRRSRNWQNLWRADYTWRGMTGFIMPRDAEGHWLDSVVWGRSRVFRPKIAYKPDTKAAPWYIPWWDTFFYEALSAEYSLSIPHDIPTLIRLCGGPEAFRRRLDTFFDAGHYNVANEPSFLTPYLYMYIGRPDLTRQRLAQIVGNHFSDRPDGLPGNDDGGAMSSWLIWAMLGRYPVAGQGKYLYVGKSGEGRVEKVHFTLNRQYRTWEVTYAWREQDAALSSLARDEHGVAPSPLARDEDGAALSPSLGGGRGEASLSLFCNGCLYLIPRSVVDHATAFCWDSPYRQGNTWQARGTFLFVSRDARDRLLSTGSFLYDGITWRLVDETDALLHVRADIDGTEMWIDRHDPLPWVVRMAGNPLGIDWELE